MALDRSALLQVLEARALGADAGISTSDVSPICADPDAEVAAFRDRSPAEQA